MLEARIIAPRGSLYYAGEATPYDLETLRQHVRDFAEQPGDEITLEIGIDDDPGRPFVTAWLKLLSNAGVRVRVVRMQCRDHAA
jgi:hypothetical protein